MFKSSILSLTILAGAAVTAAPVLADQSALAAKGEKVFRKCKACHQVGEGAKNRTGPILNGVVGGVAGTVEGFKYSKVMQAAGADGLIWTPEMLTEFLMGPRGYMKGTKMAFAGLRKPAEIDAVIAYLAQAGASVSD